MTKKPTRRYSKQRETLGSETRFPGCLDRCSPEGSKGRASSVLALAREGEKDEEMAANALLHLVHRVEVDNFRRE